MALSLSLLFLLAFPAFSQTGDLAVTIDADARVAVPQAFGAVVHVSWNGAEPAQNVTLDVDLPGELVSVHPYQAGWTCSQTAPVHCSAAQLGSDETFAGAFVQVLLPAPGTYTLTARVKTTSADANATNDAATHTVVVAGLPDLWAMATQDPSVALDPNEIGSLRAGVQNRGDAATNVVLRVSATDGGTIVDVRPDVTLPGGEPLPPCAIEGGEAVCRWDRIAPGSYTQITLHFRAPNRTDGGTFAIIATVDGDQDDFNPSDDSERTVIALRRFMTVTNASDGGSGSLRQALEDANAQCVSAPCTISLAGAGIVRPTSPLPVIISDLRIDGGAERAQIDGSLLPTGTDGLSLAGCVTELRNLVIRNVPRHAIEAHQVTGRRCDLGFNTGLLVQNTELVNNERGIVALGVSSELRENVIHENRRSGVFIQGAWYSVLRNNVIVNNGASGVFIDNAPTVPGFIPAGAELVENVIHGNAEFGIARTRTGLVEMTRNSLARNGLYAYDVDLDLATPNRDDDTIGVPNKPVLLSATYDPATNTTIVRGTATTFVFDFYASDSRDARGGPQAERWLASGRSGVDRPNFEVALPGDLRGQWITATATRTVTLYFLRTDKTAPRATRPSSGADTSELSDAIEVH